MSEPTTDDGRRRFKLITAPSQVTNDHKNSQRRKLTPQHFQAIELLLQGRNDGEVATQVEVARETVNRWRNRNPIFMAELNRRRLDIWHATRERLRHLGARALDVLDDKLKAGNAKVALALLTQVQEQSCPSAATTVAEAISEIIGQEELTSLLQRLDPNKDHPFTRAMRALWVDDGEGDSR